MSIVKERIIGAITIMSNEEAEKIWELICATFALSHADEEIPDDDELEAIKSYKEGNPDYQPTITHAELLSKLNL